MLKKLTIAAFALSSVAAFAGQDWDNIDPSSASTSELKKLVTKHAYKTMSAGDAYTLESYLNRIPSNVENAVLKGLAHNTLQAKAIRQERQMAANMMPPMGDGSMTGSIDNWNAENSSMDESRAMRMYAAKSQPAEISYNQTLDILTSNLSAVDQGLIFTQFQPKPFTESAIPTVMNEGAMDAITRYIQTNAQWTEPYRLKYTSFAPRAAYTSPITWTPASR